MAHGRTDQAAESRGQTRQVLTRIGVVVAGYLVYVLAVSVLPLGARAADALPANSDAQVLLGQRVWRASGCTSCHAIYGLGGHTGPDLTNAYSRMGEAYLRTVIGKGVRAMPAFELSDERVDSVVAFLKHADRTGVYPTSSAFAPVFGVGR